MLCRVLLNLPTRLLLLFSIILVQVCSEIATQRIQLVGGHNGAHRRLELSLCVELLELGKLCSKIYASKFLGVGADPLVAQSPG